MTAPRLVEGLPGDAGVPVVRLGRRRHHRRKRVPRLDVRQHAVGALPHRLPLPRIRDPLRLQNANPLRVHFNIREFPVHEYRASHIPRPWTFCFTWLTGCEAACPKRCLTITYPHCTSMGIRLCSDSTSSMLLLVLSAQYMVAASLHALPCLGPRTRVQHSRTTECETTDCTLHCTTRAAGQRNNTDAYVHSDAKLAPE
jgi:hypothetical protein